MALVKSKKGTETFPTLLSDFFSAERFFGPVWDEEYFRNIPAVNIRENEKGFKIELAAPGYKKEDFRIRVEENLLTVAAEREEKREEENERFTRKEFSRSSFSRSFTLPAYAEIAQINAGYEDGILRIEIPKKDEAKKISGKTISVK